MLTLTAYQQEALQKVFSKQFTLLHGITGSGKTEVYIRAVKQVVAEGKQAIILVPEISLTPQTVERFSLHFKTAVLHSHLSKKQRSLEWQKIQNNEIEVVIGARSALFAPVNSLGLIVLDEEHDQSFKQDSHPHYHAREAAIKRAELTGARVILGSATPSLESYYLATNDPKWQIVGLPERIDNRALPKVEIVDLKAELKSGNRTVLSHILRSALQTVLAEKKQAILLQNRRG
ncbi:MAG: primosomal protein N', partial [Candidatus Margulisiibacteriota bacterium]